MTLPNRKTLAVLGGAAVLVGLYAASRYNYLFFHSLAELFSIVIACGIFMVAWNSRRILENSYVLFLGIAYLFVAGLDLVHTMAYKGMNFFPGYDANLATQLWIAARYMESVSLLLAPLFIGRRMAANRVLAVYAAVFVLLLWLVFGGAFPVCFVEGAGLTPFKKISEYVISLILVGAVYFLHRKKESFEKGVLSLLYASILVTIASELAFTFYVSAYGFSNLVGHYLKLVSFALLYRAVVVTGLREPYNILYNVLKRSEEKYHSLFAEMLNGFAYHKIITDDSGRPVDYIFLEVNDAFERLTGLKRDRIIGKRVTEVLPGIERDPADWIGRYGRVALTGGEDRFEQFAEPLGRWYSVSAYSPQREYFSVIFEDITERKRAEMSLRKENREISLVNRVQRVFVEETGDDMFDKALKAVLEGLKSRQGVFGYIDEGGVLVCPSMTKMLKQCEIEGKCIHYPPEKWKGLWARALREKRALYVNTAPWVPPGHPVIENNLAVPILFHGRVIGLFNLANKEGGYTEEDRELMESVSDRVAPLLYAWIQKEMREGERRRAEEAIRLNERRLAALYELSLKESADIGEIALFVQERAVELTKSRIGFLGFLDEAQETMAVYGWSRETMETCEMSDRPLVFSLEGAGLWAEAVRKRVPVVINDYANYEGEKKGLPPGHAPLSRILSVPVFDGGRVVAVAAVGNKGSDYDEADVTQLVLLMGAMWRIYRKRLYEKKIAGLLAQLNSIFDNLPVGVAYLDTEMRFQSANRFFTALVGMPEAGLIGKHCYDTVGEYADDPSRRGRERICSFCKFGEAAKLGKPVVMERPFGGRTLKVTSVPEIDADGKITHILELVEDVTNEKEAQEVIRRYQEHLEELVVERTSELIKANEELEEEMAERERAEVQLLQSQKMEAVGELAGGIAHDFNNRLFAIRNYAFILKSASSDLKVVENAERILASCDKAAKLVDDLMRFSRKKEINPRPADLNGIVREAKDILEVAAGKAVELRFELADTPLQVMADAVLMEHVFLNLVNNARDVMPDGGSITIKTGVAGAESIPAAALNDGGHAGSYAFVSVSDTGPGMDERTRQRIFEPFFTTKEAGKGTGLGLAIVYGTVRQHGGHIDVESEPGKGTTFRIFLPLS